MASKKQRSKSKRSSSSGSPRNYAEMYKDDRTVPASATVVAVESAPAGSRDVNWSSEYSYVLGDLSKLLIVSVVVIVLMIVAGLVI